MASQDDTQPNAEFSQPDDSSTQLGADAIERGLADAIERGIADGKALAYAQVPFEIKMGSDQNSGVSSDWNLTTWRPSLGSNRPGWYYLGESWAKEHYPAQPPQALIVKALEPDALMRVKDWVKVWDDQGSEAKSDYSTWRGIPPNEDYVVVGGIFSNNSAWAPPDDLQTGGIMAIRKDLVVHGGVLGMTWKDVKSGAKKDGSTWALNRYSGNPGKIFTNCMIPQLGWGEPPSDRVWSLNPEKCMSVSV